MFVRHTFLFGFGAVVATVCVTFAFAAGSAGQQRSEPGLPSTGSASQSSSADRAVHGPHAAGLHAAPGLNVEVSGPAQVTAGRTATFTVVYADGTGRLSGTREEWGDGQAADSQSWRRCRAGGSSGDLQGSYRVSHKWTTPGTYSIELGVRTSACGPGGAAGAETATDVVTVQVVAAP
jgi:hypothetical protein